MCIRDRSTGTGRGRPTARAATNAMAPGARRVHTELGPVTLEVPRDRDGTFEPVVVRKRQRRLNGVDEMVLSLSA